MLLSAGLVVKIRLFNTVRLPKFIFKLSRQQLKHCDGSLKGKKKANQ
jgi:hypothetical protein